MFISRIRSFTFIAGLLTFVITGCNTGGSTDLNYKTAIIDDHII